MTVGLSNLPKIVRKRRRLGRGEGSRGKTSGRGQKGQKARSKVGRGFEGGQMPLYRRLPKGGFKIFHRPRIGVVKVGALNRFADHEEITPEKLKAAGLIGSRSRLVKILAGGVLKKSLKVNVHRFSTSAKSAIEAAGGSAHLLT